jgi:hypothetical protein
MAFHPTITHFNGQNRSNPKPLQPQAFTKEPGFSEETHETGLVFRTQERTGAQGFLITQAAMQMNTTAGGRVSWPSRVPVASGTLLPQGEMWVSLLHLIILPAGGRNAGNGGEEPGATSTSGTLPTSATLNVTSAQGPCLQLVVFLSLL